MSFGLRSSFGLFMTPMSEFHSWGRDVLGTALAIQNLSWGVMSVFAGGLADRYGNLKVILGAVMLYSVGILWMSFAAIKRLEAICGSPPQGLTLSCSGLRVAQLRFVRTAAFRPELFEN